MSEESSLSESMKGMLGMIAGSIATNAAIIAELSASRVTSGESLRKRIDSAAAELGLSDPAILKGMDAYLASMRNATKGGDGE